MNDSIRALTSTRLSSFAAKMNKKKKERKCQNNCETKTRLNKNQTKKIQF